MLREVFNCHGGIPALRGHRARNGYDKILPRQALQIPWQRVSDDGNNRLGILIAFREPIG